MRNRSLSLLRFAPTTDVHRARRKAIFPSILSQFYDDRPLKPECQAGAPRDRLPCSTSQVRPMQYLGVTSRHIVR